MATGIGIPPDANGTGTTPEDVQLVTAAKYENAGILTGAAVSKRSNWAYDVSRGAVLVDTGPGMAVEVPVAAQTLTPPTTAGGPASTHTVYVKQNIPGVDGNSLAVVGITAGSAPGGSVVLDRFSVPTGANTTNAATSIYDRNYARVSGASLGLLGTNLDADKRDWSYAAILYRGHTRITVPTDRWLDIRLTETCVICYPGGGNVNSESVSSMMFKIYIDNELRRSWEVGISRLYESKQMSFFEEVSAGAHTVHYSIAMQYENPNLPATARNWKIVSGGSEQWPGNRISIYDGGVRK